MRWRQGGEGRIRVDFGEARTVSQLIVRTGSASDVSIHQVAFRIRGQDPGGAVRREDNRFSLDLAEPLPDRLETEAQGTTADGTTVIAPAVTRRVVRPQIDAATFSSLPGLDRRGDWSLQTDGSLLSPSRGRLLVTGDQWGDVIVEADMQVLDASGRFRIVFRAQNDRDYDRYEFQRTRTEMHFVRDGSAARIRRNFDTVIRTGQRYSICMELFGKSARLFVDGVPVFSFQPLDHPRGGFGFETDNAPIRIHNLRAYLADNGI